jgi:hypothetical protein
MKHEIKINWSTKDGRIFETEEEAVAHCEALNMAEMIPCESIDKANITTLIKVMLTSGWKITPPPAYLPDAKENP